MCPPPPPSVPCIPEDLEASVSCSNNVASLKWSNNNLGQIFNVKALGTDGHVDKCRSTDNQCDLTQLHCGQHYTATVTAEDAECISKPSESVTFKTGVNFGQFNFILVAFFNSLAAALRFKVITCCDFTPCVWTFNLIVRKLIKAKQ